MCRVRQQWCLLAQAKGRILPVVVSVSPFFQSPSGWWRRVRPSLHLRPNRRCHSFSVAASLGILGPCPWGRAVSFRGGGGVRDAAGLWCSCGCMPGCPFRVERAGRPRRRVWPRCLGAEFSTVPSEPCQSLMALYLAPGLTPALPPARTRPSAMAGAWLTGGEHSEPPCHYPRAPVVTGLAVACPVLALPRLRPRGGLSLPGPSHALLRACGHPAGHAGRGRPRRPPAMGCLRPSGRPAPQRPPVPGGRGRRGSLRRLMEGAFAPPSSKRR